MGRLCYLRPPRDQLLRITRWRRECAGLMGRLTVSMHQESPRSASIWARTRIFPNSKHGKIFFLAIQIGKLLRQEVPVRLRPPMNCSFFLIFGKKKKREEVQPELLISADIAAGSFSSPFLQLFLRFSWLCYCLSFRIYGCRILFQCA